MATTNLGIVEVSASQSQKEVTINEAFHQLDAVMTSTLDVNTAAGGTIALTADQFQEHMRYKLTGAPAGAFTFQVPGNIKRFFLVRNESGQTATIRQTASPGATVSIVTGTEQLVYADGGSDNNIRSVAAGASAFVQLTDVSGALTGNGLKTLRVNAAGNLLEYGPKSTVTLGAFQESEPGSSAIILRYVFAEASTFPDDFAGSVGHIGIAATATTVLDVQKNGVSVGSISISTLGAFTFATTGTTVAMAAGDRLDVLAPSSPDDTAAQISITLLANKD